MFYALIALCAVISTFSICRYFAAKTRLVENNIKAVVERKLATSDYGVHLSQLKEENAIMRNILLDLVENETTLPVAQGVSQADIARFKHTKIQRYREALAESVHVLQQSGSKKKSEDVTTLLSATSGKSL